MVVSSCKTLRQYSGTSTMMNLRLGLGLSLGHIRESGDSGAVYTKMHPHSVKQTYMLSAKYGFGPS